jgi:hypothetical protein
MLEFYLEPSDKKTKKWIVSYINPKTKRVRTINFGAKGMTDFILSKGDKKRKERYLLRHSKMGEDWTDPETAGFFSRWLLWNKKSLKASIKDTERRFNIKIHLIE